MDEIKQCRQGRRQFLKRGSATIAASVLAVETNGFSKWLMSPVDEANVHNMLIVGQKTVFLSHLPMFSEPGLPSPHRYQVILEATFTSASGNPQAQYASDRQNNPNTRLYTLSPGKVVLPDLVSGNRLTSFKAKLFRGHLEKDGVEILTGVDVSLTRVIHFREFSRTAKKPAKLQYLLFGKGEELFLTHFISRPPDFDQVISVTAQGHTFSDEELSQGMLVVFPARANSIAKRLTSNEEAAARITGSDTKASPVNVTLKAGTEFYFEEGELKVPAIFDQTAAERKAGFQ
ncbi:MAG TPA: hypothetical protein VFV34_07885 [Blastocatellia bacterium]|nr:hypothetical protein [Blastocatellia bacterium]